MHGPEAYGFMPDLVACNRSLYCGIAGKGEVSMRPCSDSSRALGPSKSHDRIVKEHNCTGVIHATFAMLCHAHGAVDNRVAEALPAGHSL